MLKPSSRVIALFALVFVSLAAVLFIINTPRAVQAVPPLQKAPTIAANSLGYTDNPSETLSASITTTMITGPIVTNPIYPVERNIDLRQLPQRGPDTKDRVFPVLPLLRSKSVPLQGEILDLSKPDPTLQTQMGAAQMLSLLKNFDGLDQANWGVGWPPDTNGDVGPRYYIQTVNTSIGVFEKSTGTRVAAFTFDSFFDGTGTPCDDNNQGDPVVIYDALDDRWIITDFAYTTNWLTGDRQPPYYECIAVSKTGDPVSGGWWMYGFLTDNTQFPDYPKFGIWTDGFYMSTNMFATDFVGAKAWAFNRSDLIGGVALRNVSFQLATTYGSILPSNLRGELPPAGTPAFFISGQSPNILNLWKFHVDWNNALSSTFTGPVTLTVPGFVEPGDIIPQRDTSTRLDSLSDRLMMQLQYRKIGSAESLWVNHTISNTATGSTGIRWYEVRNPNGAPVVYQQGAYAPDANYRWMGSLAVDHDGNMALGYSVSSADMYPAIRYTGRLFTDTLGTLPQAEQSLVEGAGSQTANGRWGDYSAMTIDPADDCTFWFTTEYYTQTGGNWQTRIGSFKFPSCFNIIAPSASNPAYAGAFNNPSKIIIQVAKPSNGLTKSKFTATIGSATATIVTLYEGSDEYTLEILPPVQSANGSYILTITANTGPRIVSDSVANAVHYAATNNVDVALVLDRSGSMYDYNKMQAAQDAAKQFVDFMQVGDMVGVVGFDDVVETPFPLTTILPVVAVPPLFSDDMEAGTSNWIADAPWGLTTDYAHSTSHAWTDSPAGYYDNNMNVSLQTAAPIAIANSITTPVLGFWHIYNTESGYDYGYVEVSSDGGSSWTTLARYSGTNLTWSKVEIDLSAYKGQSILVRFRFASDGSVIYDGWYIDDVTIGQSTADVKALAKTAIDLLYPRYGTSIGGGLQGGQNQLVTNGKANDPWAIILMTDGQENTWPYVADVLPSIKSTKTIIHTIGLGAGADEALLLDIAAQTGGIYNFAPTGDQLAAIYNTIAGTISNRQTLLAATGIAQQGVTDLKDVVVDSTVSEATFSISWSNNSSNIDLNLRKPNGQLITPAVALSDPNIEYVAGPTYKYYRIKTPTLAAGVWQMQITGGSVSAALGKGKIAMPSGESYIARATAQAGLTMQFALDHNNYLTTEPIKLVVTLSDNQPIHGAAVNVTVQPPSIVAQAIRSGKWINSHSDTVPDPSEVAKLEAAAPQAVASIALYDDGLHGDGAANDGVYANIYTSGDTAGTYVFSVSANGISNVGGSFTRQAQLSTYIAANPNPNIQKVFLPLISRSGSGGTSYNWLDATTGGAIVAQGDDVYQSVNLPFAFNFYGNVYSNLYVSSNGYASFGEGYTTYSNSCIPNASTPNNAIYAFWDDLYPAGSGNGNVYVKQVDSASFVIEWYQVKQYSSSAYQTFEIVLRNDNSITLQYQSVSNTGSATTGVEDANGALAQQYLCNGAGTPLSNPLAIRYTTP
jgi:hypothetical protein